MHKKILNVCRHFSTRKAGTVNQKIEYHLSVFRVRERATNNILLGKENMKWKNQNMSTLNINIYVLVKAFC